MFREWPPRRWSAAASPPRARPLAGGHQPTPPDIQGARVLPAVADQLRASARVGTVHFSNLIEGNQLPIIEAERAARGELAADTRAKIELVNYFAALDLIDRRLEPGALALTPEFL